MPEPIPTTEVNTEGKPKKLPKWALIAIIGGGVFALLLYKHKRQKEEEEKGGEIVGATTGGQTAEAVQPVSSGGNLINAAREMQKENDEFLKNAIAEEEMGRGGVNRITILHGNRAERERGGRGTVVTGTKGSTRSEAREHLEERVVNPPAKAPTEPPPPKVISRESTRNKLPINT